MKPASCLISIQTGQPSYVRHISDMIICDKWIDIDLVGHVRRARQYIYRGREWEKILEDLWYEIRHSCTASGKEWIYPDMRSIIFDINVD